jgi:hypothetical protein
MQLFEGGERVDQIGSGGGGGGRGRGRGQQLLFYIQVTGWGLVQQINCTGLARDRRIYGQGNLLRDRKDRPWQGNMRKLV